MNSAIRAVPTKASKKAASYAGEKLDGHHLFPRMFVEYFRKMEIGIDDFILDIWRSQHQSIHRAGVEGSQAGGVWNQAWREFFADAANQNLKDPAVKKRAFELPFRLRLCPG